MATGIAGLKSEQEYGPNMVYNTCRFCGEVLPFTYFNFRKDNDSYRNECRPCKSIKDKEYHKSKKDYFNELNRQYSKNNKEKIAEYNKARAGQTKTKWSMLKRTAKYKSIELNISFEQFKELTESNCYYCNGKMKDDGIWGYNIDRIDSSKGYIVGNILPCCKYCNTIKNNFLTKEETKAAVEAVLKVREEQK